MMTWNLRRVALSLLYAILILLVYFLAPGSSGVFIYQGF
jgi:hypothetical protein